MNTLTKFTPMEAAPPEVDVEITERIATDAEVVKEMQALGFVRMTEQHLTTPAKLGASIHKKGVLRSQRGSAFVTQNRLSDTLEVMHQRLIEVSQTKPGAKKENNKTEQMCKLAHEIGFTAGKLTESQAMVMATEGARPPTLPPPNETPPNMAFPVGTNVPKEIHYHVHNDKPAEKPVAENA